MFRDYLFQVSRFSRPSRLFLMAEAFYGVGQSAVWVLRGLYLKKAGFSESEIGQTLSVSAAGMALVVLLLPPLMDRRRLRPFQLAAVAALAGGLAGVAWVRERPLVLAMCFLSGLGSALLEVSSAPFFMRHSEGEERPYLFGVSTALSPAAGLLATLGMKAGALAWGEILGAYRDMLWVAAGITLVAWLPLMAVRETPPEPAPRKEAPFDWSTAARFCVPELLFGLGAGLTIPFINLYFNVRFGVPAGTIGLYYSFAQALMMGAFLMAPLLARRLGAVRTIVCFQLASIPFFLALAFTTSLPFAVATFLLRHACMNMVHPVSTNFMMEVMNPGQRARMSGLRQTANKLAWVVATWAGGRMIEHAPFMLDGFTTVMLVTIVFYVAGSALYWRFLRGEAEGRVIPPGAEPTSGA